MMADRDDEHADGGGGIGRDLCIVSTYLCRAASNVRLNHAKKPASVALSCRPRAAPSTSAGVSDSATIPDRTTEMTMVTANCLYSAPVMPPMKATGMKTEQSTITIAISALAQLPDRPIGGHACRDVLVLHGALDVFDDDDRVVHHDADRQHQSEEREQVDRESEHRHPEKRADDRDGHGQRRDERRAPVLQEDVHHDRDQDDREEERELDLVNRRRNERRQVEPDRPSAPRAGSVSASSSIRATTPSLASSAFAPARRNTINPPVGFPLRRITLS